MIDLRKSIAKYLYVLVPKDEIATEDTRLWRGRVNTIEGKVGKMITEYHHSTLNQLKSDKKEIKDDTREIQQIKKDIEQIKGDMRELRNMNVDTKRMKEDLEDMKEILLLLKDKTIE